MARIGVHHRQYTHRVNYLVRYDLTSTLRLGGDGERAVGQTLDTLRGKGYRIFHDLIGGEFNLDHVILNEHGFFSIETINKVRRTTKPS